MIVPESTDSTRENRHRCASSHNEVPPTSQTPVGWGRRLGNIYWRGWSAVMVAKCTNPSCSTAFRHLEEGTLFRLEADPTLRLSNPMTPEYCWLCRSCSAAMTLHISKEGKVIPVTFPAPVHGGPSGSDFIASMRQEGLLLSCVSFSTERHRRRGIRRKTEKRPCRMNGMGKMEDRQGDARNQG